MSKEDIPPTYKEKLERVKQYQEKLRGAAIEKEEMAQKAVKTWEDVIQKRRSVIDSMMAEMEEEKENAKILKKERRMQQEKDQSGWFMMSYQEEKIWLEQRAGSMAHIEVATMEKLKDRSEKLIAQTGIELSNLRAKIRQAMKADEICDVMTELRGHQGIDKWEGSALKARSELRGWLNEIIKIMKRRLEREEGSE